MYQALITSLRNKNYCNDSRTEVKKKEMRCQPKKRNVYQFIKPKLVRVGCILQLAIKDLDGKSL